MADDLRLWFPLYAHDMLNSRKVRKMQAEEFGIFMFLLIEQWAGGPLPDDQGDLCDMAKSDWPAVRKILQAQFVKTDKGWVNERLVEIWQEQDARRQRKSRAGKAGAEARWGKKLKIVADEAPVVEVVLPTEEDGNRIPPATADAMPSQSDTNGNESIGKESIEKESITDTPTNERPKKQGEAKPDVIRIRNGLRWGKTQHPAKRGYKEITREYFEDVMYVTKDEVPFPENLVIETQEELDVWLSATT